MIIHFTKGVALLFLLLCTDVIAQTKPSAAWEEKSVAEMTLETDLRIIYDSDLTDQGEAHMFLSGRGWKSTGTDNSLHFSLTRLEMKPNLSLDLDKAAKESMKQMAISLDDDEPKSEIEVVKVSNLEARLAKLTSYARVVTSHMDSLLVRDGQKVFQLNVFYTPNRAEDAKRLLESFKISRSE